MHIVFISFVSFINLFSLIDHRFASSQAHTNSKSPEGKLLNQEHPLCDVNTAHPLIHPFHTKGMAGDILDTLDQLYGKWIVAQSPLFLKEMQLSIENLQFTKKKTAWVHTDLAMRGGEYKVFIP